MLSATISSLDGGRRENVFEKNEKEKFKIFTRKRAKLSISTKAVKVVFFDK